MSQCFFLAGPTGVGKTAIALSVAERCGGEIIGADAFQIYREIPVLTVQPSEEEKARVSHHLVGVVSVSDTFDAARYVARARERIADIVTRGKLPIIVGGSGFYMRTLAAGLPAAPSADRELREQYSRLDLAFLLARLAELDPEAARQIDQKNRRRVVRALEVCELTGTKFSSAKTIVLPAGTHGVCLVRDREDLYGRINARVTAMFAGGVRDEVRQLPEMSATAAKAIGLDDIRSLNRGEISEPECVARIQQATRHYAKRQLTWFRREAMFEPLNLSQSSPSSVLEFLSGKTAALQRDNADV